MSVVIRKWVLQTKMYRAEVCDLQKKYSKVVEMPRIRKIYSFAVPDCQRAIQESE